MAALSGARADAGRATVPADLSRLQCSIVGEIGITLDVKNSKALTMLENEGLLQAKVSADGRRRQFAMSGQA